tara:strand:- start:685 stop:984 length:300 start_codon:yes stop_codon:yes gene_type:complete
MNQVVDKKRIKSKIKPPRNYFVIFKNDDYTSMEFVVYALMMFFDKSQPDAERIMMNVHTKGEGVAGIYPYQIAEQKSFEVMKEAKENNYPLQIVLKESD